MTRYFTEDHEWIEVDGDSATVGITDYAQSQLGDIVFAEVPATGATLKKGGDAAVVERAKAGDPMLKSAPHHAPRRRLDETQAARKPVLSWREPEQAVAAE